MRLAGGFSTLSICNVFVVGLFLNFFQGLESQGNENCKNKLDIFFLIDGSGSLGEEDFLLSKDLVSQILGMYNIPDRNRAGYAVFTASINNVRYLTPEISNLLVHLEYEQYPATRTNLFNALRFVYEDVFKHNNQRANTDRVLVVLTDGRDERDLGELIRKLEMERRVRIIVFGFGDDIDQAQLETIATDPDSDNLFTFSSLSDGINSIQMLGNAICPGAGCCARGKQGKMGPRGLNGERGEKGILGPKGSCRKRDPECTLRLRKGEKGFKGELGVKGTNGFKGRKGIVGVKGLKGDMGLKGLNGSIGSKGLKGEKGINGTKGEKGIQGVKGEQGEIGVEGKKGEQGIQGLKGEVGPIGVCRNSTFNTNSSCKGNKGDMGVKGRTGLNGTIGFKGANGSDGQKGDKGTKGLRGEIGPDGKLGDEGERGDAIRYREQLSSSCSEPGSLFFDKIKKLLYYCDETTQTYKCIGADSKGSCTDCTCVIGGQVLECESDRFISRSGSACTTSTVAVDFILIVDDSFGNVNSQRWIKEYIPILNQRLLDQCIGLLQVAPNRAQIIGFGGAPFLRAPHFVTPDKVFLYKDSPGFSTRSFTMSDFESAIDNLQNLGDGLTGNEEPGYEALEFALDYAVLRPSTEAVKYVPLFLFVSDEETACNYSDSKFEEIVERFRQRSPSVLEFIINPRSFNASGLDNIFGVSYSNNQDLNVWSYNATQTDRSTVAIGSVQTYLRDRRSHREIKRHYIDLAMCTQRASTHVWNMEPFLTNSSIVNKVSDAFISQSIETVIEQGVTFTCQHCYCDATGNSNCIQLEGKILCDCLDRGVDRRCPCVRQQIQNLLEGASNMTIPMIELACDIENTLVGIEMCREFIVEPTAS